MGLLLNLYWICLGVGALYILVAGSLGAIGAGGHGGAGDAGGHDLGGHDFSGHVDAAGGHDAGLGAGHGDVAADGGADSESVSLELAHGADHGSIIAGHAPQGHSAGDLSHISPLNLLNLMCFLASFGGTGLALMASHFPPLFTFPCALVGGIGVTALFHFFVARVLYSLQGGGAPTQEDMLGLEAEVLTPLEEGKFGEVAYTLGGARFTARAKLLRGGTAHRAETVRIMKVDGSTVYVEPMRKLLG